MITEFKVAQLLDLRVLELVFRIESGVVVDTEQRSDSHVYGSGYTMNWNGTGGGSSYVATRVSVNRDIFVKDAADREAHIRVNFDLPCRKGHVIHVISFGKVGGDAWHRYAIYNGNLKSWWYFSEKDQYVEVIYQELLPELDRMTALYQAEPVDRDGVESLVKELEDRYAEAFERHTKEFEATASDREKEKTARVKRVFKGIFVVLGCVLGFPALISLIQNLPSAPYVPPKLTEQELRVQTAQFEQIERERKAQEAEEMRRREAEEMRQREAALATQAEERARDAARKAFFGKWSGVYVCVGWQRDAPATLEVTDNLLVITVSLPQGPAREEHRWGFDAATGIARFSNTMLKVEGDTILLRSLSAGSCGGTLYRSS